MKDTYAGWRGRASAMLLGARSDRDHEARRRRRLDFEVEFAGGREGGPAQIVAACDRARSTLKWQPQFDDLQTMVSLALAWKRKLAARTG